MTSQDELLERNSRTDPIFPFFTLIFHFKEISSKKYKQDVVKS